MHRPSQNGIYSALSCLSTIKAIRFNVDKIIMKNILVVDDEIDLAESVSCFLDENGYASTYCDSVDQAILNLASKSYDLIISDIKMPNKDGLVFYNTIKDEIKKKNIPFVFMTGHSEKVNMQSAYQMGVDEFVSKPFDLEDLKSVVNLLLKGNADQAHQNQKFYRITLREFLQTSTNQYDIFLKVNENYLCLVKKGQELMPERLLNYHNKGMTYIYLSAEDFSHYIDMQINISSLINNKPLHKMKKVQLFNHFCKSISESALNQHITEDVYQKAYTSFENYTQISLDNNDLFNLIYSYGNNNADASTRSVLVSFLALVIFQHWGWTNPKHLSRISLSALLCDVGLNEMSHLANKSPSEMSNAEQTLYEKHPLQSYMLLSKIKGIPSEILYVAVQHHENELGLGFPHKLGKLKLHPYARIIHALVQFMDKVDTLHSKKNIQEALDTLLGFEKKMISLQVLKTLYIIFNFPVPKEIEKVLLPTDTTRLT